MRSASYLCADGDFVTIEQMCKLVNLGETKVRQIAKDAGAILKVGRNFRINKRRFYQYLETIYTCK